MAVMNVNPTRMELSRLKKKLVSLKRGHKILKDKRDELMRQFLLLVKENKELRIKVEKGITEANLHMALANGIMKVSLDVKKRSVMSVDVPSFELQLKSGDKSDVYSYGFAFTSSELDSGVKSLTDILPDMLRLAEVEKTCQLLSSDSYKKMHCSYLPL